MERFMNSSPVAALIGAGAIAPFHIAALRAAGFRVSHIAASNGSSRASQLAKDWSIERAWTRAEDLIVSAEWDAIVLASSTESIPELLQMTISTGRPCLVEKPVGFDGDVIRQFSGHDAAVRVAYNRRFYSSSLAARTYAAQGPCIFRMELPDSIGSVDVEMQGLRSVRENSVHGFDLLAFVLGNYRVDKRFDTGDPRGRLAVITSDMGHVGTVVLNWNCPANFSLALDRSPQRFEMRPFELGSLYEGMDVLEPTDDIPVRRYVPKLVQQVSSFPGPDGVKPGFLGQALSLMQCVKTGQWDARTATISDAAFAADVARTLTS